MIHLWVFMVICVRFVLIIQIDVIACSCLQIILREKFSKTNYTSTLCYLNLCISVIYRV